MMQSFFNIILDSSSSPFRHDFRSNGRGWSNDEGCDKQGIMSYGEHKEGEWSECSRKDQETKFKEMLNKCMVVKFGGKIASHYIFLSQTSLSIRETNSWDVQVQRQVCPIGEAIRWSWRLRFWLENELWKLLLRRKRNLQGRGSSPRPGGVWLCLLHTLQPEKQHRASERSGMPFRYLHYSWQWLSHPHWERVWADRCRYFLEFVAFLEQSILICFLFRTLDGAILIWTSTSWTTVHCSTKRIFVIFRWPLLHFTFFKDIHCYSFGKDSLSYNVVLMPLYCRMSYHLKQ